MRYVENVFLVIDKQESLSTQILVFANSFDEKKCQTLSFWLNVFYSIASLNGLGVQHRYHCRI